MKGGEGQRNVLTKLAEVPVGEEPVCVAADGRRAFVANAVSGTVSVVEWTGVGFEETAEFAVGTEPRGCALSGTRLYVTNFTEGTVAVVDTKSKKVVDKVKVGGNPYGITVVGNDVFVTQFFARLIDGGPGEGFDDGKEGVVQHFRRNNFNLDEITLAPLADSGFTANRVNLCQQFNPRGSRTTRSVRIRMPPTRTTPIIAPGGGRSVPEPAQIGARLRWPALSAERRRAARAARGGAASTSTPTSRRSCTWSTLPRSPNARTSPSI